MPVRKPKLSATNPQIQGKSIQAAIVQKYSTLVTCPAFPGYALVIMWSKIGIIAPESKPVNAKAAIVTSGLLEKAVMANPAPPKKAHNLTRNKALCNVNIRLVMSRLRAMPTQNRVVDRLAAKGVDP